VYAGRKFVRQLTRQGEDPSYRITPEYRAYIQSQPPDVQLELMDQALSFMNTKSRKYYLKHFHQLPSYTYDYSVLDRDLPYNTSTHRQKYYY